MNLEAWWPDWSGQICVIVASGPSAAEANLDAIRGLAKVIAVNSSWQLAPWADVLYACDAKWWRVHDGVPEFRGLKISQDEGLGRFNDIAIVKSVRGLNEILTDERGVIGWGGNSGFQAMNLAVQFGAKTIVLVGFDMNYAATPRQLRWHGNHGHALPNPSNRMVEGWRDVLDANAPRLKALGVEILNASQGSALSGYPKVRLSDIFPPRISAAA